MILEHAVLDVVPGEESAFERAFVEARAIIASMAGFRSLSLARCVEQQSRYLLLVEWERLEDHTEGFRGSAEYQTWRQLLHHFYEPFPAVEHYEPLTPAEHKGLGVGGRRFDARSSAAEALAEDRGR